MRTATAPPAAVSASSPLVSANLVSARHAWAGQAFVYRDSPQWMYMSVADLDSTTATVRCQVMAASGQFVTLGNVPLHGGYGWWAKQLPDHMGIVHSARLVDANGTVLATATFTG
jgi:hypothetical protein